MLALNKLRIKKETFNPATKINKKDFLLILEKYVKKENMTIITNTIENVDINTINDESIRKIGYKIKVNHNRKLITIEIPKNQIKAKQVYATKPIENTKTINKYYKTKGKYSNYTNIKINVNSSLKDQKLTKNNILEFDGLSNINNLKLSYTIHNKKNNEKITFDKANLIWEEFKHVDIKLGFSNINTSLYSINNNNNITGLTVLSKEKQKKHKYYTKQKIILNEKRLIKLLVNNKEIINLILDEGETHLNNIPVNFGSSQLSIQTFDLNGNLLKEDKKIVYSRQESLFSWIKLNYYELSFGNSKQLENEKNIASKFKFDTLISPLDMRSQFGETQQQFSFYIKPFKVISLSNSYTKNNTYTNSNLGVSFQKTFNKNTPIIKSSQLSSQLYKSIDEQNKINRSNSLSTALNFQPIANINPSFRTSHSINNKGQNNTNININLGYGYTYDKRENILYQNNINLGIEKTTNKNMLFTLKLNNNLSIKQKNITYSLGFGSNGFTANMHIFWLLGKLSRVDSSLSTTGIKNNLAYNNKKENFTFNAGNTINANNTNISAGLRHNNEDFNSTAQLKQSLGKTDRQDSLSIYSKAGRVFYNFSNTENKHKSELTMQTAIAFADGHFGMKDQINGSFLIVKPNRKLKNTTLSINDNNFSLFGSHVISNLQQDQINDISVKLDSKESILMLPKSNYSIPIRKNKGEVLIIDTESSNIAIASIQLKDGSPLRYRYVSYYDEKNPDKKLDTLSSKTGQIQLVGVKAGSTYIIDSGIKNLKPAKLSIPKWVQGIYKRKAIIFEEKAIKKDIKDKKDKTKVK
eukprot:COSAG01_NODE_3_length_63519_cov_1591.007663_37_plen_810_part_00